MKLLLRFAGVFLSVFVSLNLWAASKNYVADYFNKSDLQIEAKSQCRVLISALSDALKLPAKKLKAMRYADYQGHPAQWSVNEIFRHYYVSVSRGEPSEKSFFRDYQTPVAKAALKNQIKKLGDCSGLAGI